MKKANKWLALMIAIIMVASVGLVGCGGGSSTGEKAQPAKEQVLKLNARTEPPSLDPATATDSTSGDILREVMEGLVRLNEKSQVEKGSGVAEDWTISEDGLKYTFKLKKGLKWTNGDPVTAHDFEYAWKRVLDPKTAADYAYQLFYIKNAEEYNAGKAKAEDVGVKATDDYTLEVELKAPTPYFLQLTAFYTLMPVNKKVVEANKNWAAEASTYVSNGPFKLTKWEHDKEVVLEKNPDYWNKDKVKLNKITWAMINDENTEYQLYQNNQFDIAAPPTELTKELIDKGEAKAEPILGNYWYQFNVKKPPFNNKYIRQAFAAAIDREALINNVTKGGQIPAYALVPPNASPDMGADFRKENGDFVKKPADAKALLQKGLQELGLKTLPKVTLLYNTSEGHKKIAEAIQAMWKQNLGVDVELKNQEWKVYLNTLNAGDFQISRMGWLADYMDPMTFIDYFVTNGGNNNTGWGNKEYDALVQQAKSTGDQKVRMDAMLKAEKILMDEMPIAPIYYYTRVYMQKDNVKGVVRHADGTTEYAWAYIE
ncbi:peptide ABC transporter substrate-binding protein [Tepidibacillus fermentans]|uniref:Oligopeptide transport system substrate-binding protein n=1 Tax=Tepidibacillus fermentans TaxID=1281767 RepID=A0A4R3KIY1_9BACI|nr:peptide ABC transporter substrate-binding protein [Tepidibacillus fermentans]TCS83573.1 oligopeptide transport system substrate-binding protein [Tepidibacillus fermentans]